MRCGRLVLSVLLALCVGCGGPERVAPAWTTYTDPRDLIDATGLSCEERPNYVGDYPDETLVHRGFLVIREVDMPEGTERRYNGEAYVYCDRPKIGMATSPPPEPPLTPEMVLSEWSRASVSERCEHFGGEAPLAAGPNWLVFADPKTVDAVATRAGGVVVPGVPSCEETTMDATGPPRGAITSPVHD